MAGLDPAMCLPRLMAGLGPDPYRVVKPDHDGRGKPGCDGRVEFGRDGRWAKVNHSDSVGVVCQRQA